MGGHVPIVEMRHPMLPEGNVPETALRCAKCHEPWPSEVARLGTDLVRCYVALDLAWGIVANVSEGNWDKETPEWKAAAERWRDEYWHEITQDVRDRSAKERK